MGKRLYVGNLPYDADEETIRAAFSEGGGNVARVHIPLDRETQRPRGFAFVEMATDEDAQAALARMDGAMLGTRTLRVSEAEDRRPGAGGPGGPGPGGPGGPRPHSSARPTGPRPGPGGPRPGPGGPRPGPGGPGPAGGVRPDRPERRDGFDAPREGWGGGGPSGGGAVGGADDDRVNRFGPDARPRHERERERDRARRGHGRRRHDDDEGDFGGRRGGRRYDDDDDE